MEEGRTGGGRRCDKGEGTGRGAKLAKTELQLWKGVGGGERWGRGGLGPERLQQRLQQTASQAAARSRQEKRVRAPGSGDRRERRLELQDYTWRGPRHVACALASATPIDPGTNSASLPPFLPRSLTLPPADCRVAMETEQGF